MVGQTLFIPSAINNAERHAKSRYAKQSLPAVVNTDVQEFGGTGETGRSTSGDQPLMTVLSEQSTLLAQVPFSMPMTAGKVCQYRAWPYRTSRLRADVLACTGWRHQYAGFTRRKSGSSTAGLADQNTILWFPTMPAGTRPRMPCYRTAARNNSNSLCMAAASCRFTARGISALCGSMAANGADVQQVRYADNELRNVRADRDYTVVVANPRF